MPLKASPTTSDKILIKKNNFPIIREENSIKMKNFELDWIKGKWGYGA